MIIPIFPIVVMLVIAALILWAITQLPLDATIVRLIRVVVIVSAVLYVIYALLGHAGAIQFR